MSVVRRFLVLPALARLVRKERGGSKITEGYFAPQGGRTSLVRIDGQQCHLVLIKAGADGTASEERTEVPRAHGDALLDVCGGRAVYERTTLALSPGREIQIDRYTTPAGLDLISVPFEDENASKAFRVPIWFGTEVTAESAYDRHAIALQGPPEPARLGLNNAMLDAVLDLFEPRFGMGRFGASPTPKPADDEAARRSAGNGVGAPPAQAENPAPVPPPSAAKPPSPAPAEPAAASPPASQSAPSAAKPAPDAEAKPAPEPAAKPSVAEMPAGGGKPTEPAGNAPARPAVVESPAAKPQEAKTPASPPAPAVAQSEPKPAAAAAPQEAQKSDARIDDVIESLSQALGAAIQQPPEPAKSDDLAASFERWTVRPRRTQQ